MSTTFFKGTAGGMHTLGLYKSFSKGKREKNEKKGQTVSLTAHEMQNKQGPLHETRLIIGSIYVC